VYPKNTAIVEALSRVKLPLALSITTWKKVQARKINAPVAHHFTDDVGS